MLKHFVLIATIAALTSCNPCTYTLEPCLKYTPGKEWVKERASAFEPLTAEELHTDWGKEILIAGNFAPRLDLYRAITGYKRALILMPEGLTERRWQAEYCILLSYYLGDKPCEVVEEFEAGTLSAVPETFPVFRDMLIILVESYRKAGNPYKAQLLENVLKNYDAGAATNLELYRAIKRADFCEIQTLSSQSSNPDYHREWLDCYCSEALSVRKAQILNALLPGAGYYYAGQKRTAFTAFVLNAAFIAATYQFFHEGYTAAGIITASLEFGWYFGGINGAGLSAKLYNEHRYNCYAMDALGRNKLYPALMIEHAF
ncbi:MAG: tetratricopeptide repeat protein [Chlamydiia bacterium]|nr:tetratricopeptide repeat protein [Chlamydiia bacterium]